MRTKMIICILAVLTTGLLAGLYFGFQYSVNPGLGKLDDMGYLSAMQSINVAIQNAVFFISFLGPALLLPLAAYQYRGTGAPFYLLVSASVVFIGASLMVTMLGNVPLNNAMAAVDLKTATAEQLRAARVNFEVPWNRLHAIRTVATIVSFVLGLMALGWRE